MLARGALISVQIYCLFLGVVLLSCTPPSDVPPSEPVTITPSTMYPGWQILVDISGGDIDFSECENLSDWDSQSTAFLSVFFSFYDAETKARKNWIQLASMRYVSAERVTVMLTLNENAQVGTYEMEFQCSDDQLLTARFFVREKMAEYALQFSPGHLVNGKSGQLIDISLQHGVDEEVPTFNSKPTTVRFSVDGELIEVVDWDISEDHTTTTVEVNVSELALGVGEESKTVDVLLVCLASVYQGTIMILPGEHPTISISPGHVEKPMYNQEPLQYEITIASKDPEKASAENISYFKFEFPQNPGVHVVDDCTISDNNPLKAFCTISVDNSALLGPAAMRIKQGGMESYASVNIVPTSYSDHAVRLFPPMIPNCACSTGASGCSESSECPRELVFVKPIGFEFDNTWTVEVEDSDVQIVSDELLGGQSWALWLVDAGGTTAESVPVRFSNGTDEIVTHLLIEDVKGKALVYWNDAFRGEDDPKPLYQQDDLFLESATANLYPYSGIRSDAHVKKDDTDADIVGEESLDLRDFSVRADAPVGPSVVSISGDSTIKRNELFFNVVPQTPTSTSVSSSPQLIWLAEQQATIVFTGHGEFVFNADTEFGVNDVSLQIDNVVIDTVANTAAVSLQILRSAKRGIKTFYFRSGGHSEAVNIRAEKEDDTPLEVMKLKTISRAEGLGKVFALLDKSFVGKPTGVAIYDDIDVEIERYYTTSEDPQETGISIVFSLEPEGRGGWFGVTVSIDGRQFVIPVKIVDAYDENGNEDNSLTATPISKVVPGARNVVDLKVQLESLSGENRPLFGSLVTQVSPIMQGYDATIDHITDEGGLSAFLIADFTYTLSREMETGDYGLQIPVGITTSQGAAVGFWEIEDEDFPIAPSSFEWNDSDYTVGKSESFESPSGESQYKTINFPRYYENLETLTGPLPKKMYFMKIVAVEGSADAYTPATAYLVDPSNKNSFVAQTEDGVLWTFQKDWFQLWASSRTSWSPGSTGAGYTVTLSTMGFLGETFIATINDEADTELDSASSVSLDVCTSPRLYFEYLEDYRVQINPEENRYEDPFFDPIMFPSAESNCRLAVTVSARTLDSAGLQTPDAGLEMCDTFMNCVSVANGFDGGADPVLYVNAEEVEDLKVYGQEGTKGYYMLNIRPPAVIRQVSTGGITDTDEDTDTAMDTSTFTDTDTTTDVDTSTTTEVDSDTGTDVDSGTINYVELQMEPGVSLAGCTLEKAVFDADGNIVTAILDLSGVVPDDGRVFITTTPVGWATVLDNQDVSNIEPFSSFALGLRCNEVLLDSFQVGTGLGLAETTPFPNPLATCFARIGNAVDTNNNQYDFIRKSDCKVVP